MHNRWSCARQPCPYRCSTRRPRLHAFTSWTLSLMSQCLEIRRRGRSPALRYCLDWFDFLSIHFVLSSFFFIIIIIYNQLYIDILWLLYFTPLSASFIVYIYPFFSNFSPSSCPNCHARAIHLPLSYIRDWCLNCIAQPKSALLDHDESFAPLDDALVIICYCYMNNL